jgi:hypothetical protein
MEGEKRQVKKILRSEVGRGVAVALISVGITAAFVLPVLLVELLQSLQ